MRAAEPSTTSTRHETAFLGSKLTANHWKGQTPSYNTKCFLFQETFVQSYGNCRFHIQSNLFYIYTCLYSVIQLIHPEFKQLFQSSVII